MGRRAAGEGSLYQRKSDGKWVSTISLGFDGSGRRSRKTFYGDTQQEARLRRDRARTALLQGIRPDSKRIRVGQLLEEWLRHGIETRGWEPTTAKRHAAIARRHLIPALGRVWLDELSVRDVESILSAQLADGASPRSVQYTRGVLRSAINLATRWGLAHRNVAQLADPPPEHRVEVRALNQHEARQFLEVVSRHRLGAVYTVAMACALRQSEALALRWEDIDLDAGLLHVRRKAYFLDGVYHVGAPKTDRSRRTIPFPPEIGAILRRHRLAQAQERLAAVEWVDRELVFSNQTGGPLYGPFVTRRLQQLMERAGLPKIGFKELRHTGATLLLAMGVELSVIQKTLGHTSITTTNIYAHVLPVMQREAAYRMGEFLRGER